MAYSTNPNLPRVRQEAVRLVREGWSTREVARHLGYTQSAVVKWYARAPGNRHFIIPTRSSRPLHHPHELSSEVVDRILTMRGERHQCAEILHHRLTEEGLAVSLSSVKRTLKRAGVTYPSPWKRWHTYPPRPIAETPGILVEIDSMQEGCAYEHLHAYALVDLCSRWTHAEAMPRISTHRSLAFVEEAREVAPFSFRTLQSDHGAEFSKWLTERLRERGIAHRHSRVRTPTDNAHVERFIQTLQRECLRRIPGTLRAWRREIPPFLRYYNTERPHMALGMQIPLEILKRFQAID
ncbi:MAG: transposase [Candidatus Brennerbacteria bacterium]|nr:transposase [Candidatus Brennerbacteria bacterium]